jgi:hypothetical protein
MIKTFGKIEGMGHTWYSLISDLSKPGMKRVIDFLAVSNFTGGAMLLM